MKVSSFSTTLMASVITAAPIEYSHIITSPYRCAPCYGRVYVDQVKKCVDSYDCSQFEYGLCRVRGVFGVESMGAGDLVAAGPNFIILSGKVLPDGYLLKFIEIEFEDDSSLNNNFSQKNEGVTVSLLSTHTEIVAQQIMLRSAISTSIGQKITFAPYEHIKPTPYIRLDWIQPKKVRRVTAEFAYQNECQPAVLVSSLSNHNTPVKGS